MAFRRKSVYKDPLEEIDSDLSDISDVKPEDLDKILKSASELDNEIFSGETKTPVSTGERKKGPEVAGLSYKSTIPKVAVDDPLAEFDLTSEEEDIPKPSSSKPDLDRKDDFKHEFQTIETKGRNRGSGDWLGLKETPEKPPVISDLGKKSDPFEALKKPQSAKPPDNQKEIFNRSKTADTIISEKKDPIKRPMRKRVNILDDLFGDTLIKKDEPKFNPGDSSQLNLVSMLTEPSAEKIEPETGKYMPSLSAGRRLERRKDPPPSSGLGADSDIDWVLGPKTPISESMSTKTPEVPVTQAANTSTAPQRSESAFPDWLPRSKGIEASAPPPQGAVTSSPFRHSTQTPNKTPAPAAIPDWLGGNANENEIPPVAETSVYIPQKQESVIQNQMSQPQDTGGTGNVVGQLTNVKIQLGAAMARHSQNLQNYMQVLVNEAQRVSFADNLLGPVHKMSQHNVSIEEDDENEPKSKKIDPNLETIKHQEDVIHDQQVKINSLELQLTQMEMKIENMETMKAMEIDNLNKAHGFELEAWETRFKRLKLDFEEVVTDYEAKIVKLKKREEDVEKETKQRLESLQAERIADLEKIGEFHRQALEQAASITTPPNLSAIDVRYNAKYTNMPKPFEEVELSEREITIMEKEKQVLALKTTLELQKRELDEAIEREKVRREERERESRRILMELQFKEELNNKEIERKKEQLEVKEKQIQELMNKALKEQTELEKEKLTLAAEKARLDASIRIERTDKDGPLLQPLDMLKARAELEAALEAVNEAREIADQERRKHVELRKVAEEITWEQRDKDQQLEMRERHINTMLRDAEAIKEEGLAALEKAEIIKHEMEAREREFREQFIQIEVKEKALAKERLEIAKERLEIEKQRSLLDVFLPTLNPNEELKINPPMKFDDEKGYVDPKALIMRLRAEKDLEAFITPLKRKN